MDEQYVESLGEHEPEASSAELLHESVRRWIGAQGWTELRAIQEAAVAPILAGEEDVILAAATAAGKTEAAFLPIVSRLLEEPRESIGALYVSPLKALINDQHRRLDELGAAVGVPVHRWHGDVAAGHKARVLDEPAGILQITPESLEALFVLRASRVPALFAQLSWIVVDELHAFLGSERGRHLQSLLHRVELALGRRVPRVGLSATLGDLELAAEFLRPRGGADVVLLEDSGAGSTVRLQLRGHAEEEPDRELEELREVPVSTARQAIAQHLFETLRGADNLVFANSRREVELLADALRALSEERRVPNEFWPHHASLGRDLREEVERRLQAPEPATAICTSTLEMGIDVGPVQSVAQIGAPPSVAALRQRLGRSGRRGEPATMRLYVRERERAASESPGDTLREELVQTAAMLELLVEGWCEPPTAGALHLSTLVHQVLARIAESGGVRADETFRELCETGPFGNVDRATFAALLRAMGAADLIVQQGDGELVVGLAGERAAGHYSFYAVFQSRAEHRLVHGARTLGTVPLTAPLAEGDALIFAGRRWRVAAVDSEKRVVSVEPGTGGRPPVFRARLGSVHGRVRGAMKVLYESDVEPPYLNRGARALLAEARRAYAELGLAEHPIAAVGADAWLFPWCGDPALFALSAGLRASGLEVSPEGFALRARGALPADVRAALDRFAAADGRELTNERELARAVQNKETERFDRILGEELLAREWASRTLDVEGARAVADALLESL